MSEPTAAPVPGTPEYDQAMAAKFESHQNGVGSDDGTPNPESEAKPQRPEWFPENLWKPELSLEDNSKALATSYAEARKVISQPKPVEPPKSVEPPKPSFDDQVKAHADGKAKLEADLAALKAKPDAKPEDVQALEKQLKDYPPAPQKPAEEMPKALQGVDIPKLASEWTSKGTLTSEDYAELEKRGFTRQDVDSFFAGAVALAEKRDSQILSGAEMSREQFDAVSKWAAANLSDAEKVAMNEALANGTPEAAALALKGLHTKYTAANGADPKLLGGSNKGGSNEGFKSFEEYKAAMKDPRYQKDEAYRKSVMDRLSVSNI